MLNTDRFDKFCQLVYKLQQAYDKDNPNYKKLREQMTNHHTDALTNKHTRTAKFNGDSEEESNRALYKYVQYVIQKSEKYSIVDRDLNFLKEIKLPKDLKLSHLQLPSKRMYIDVDVGVAKGILVEVNTVRRTMLEDGKQGYVVDRLSTLQDGIVEMKQLVNNTKEPKEKARLNKLANKLETDLASSKEKLDSINEPVVVPSVDKLGTPFGASEYDDDDELPETYRILRMWYRWISPEGDEVLENTSIPLDDTDINSINSRKTNVIRQFLYKLLLFIMERDIRIVERGEDFLRKRNSNRRLRGKTPIPSFNVVAVTGVLRKTIDKVNKSVSEGRKLGHRFKVVANYMHFWDRKRYRRLYSLTDKEMEKELISWCHYPLPDGTFVNVLRKLRAECVKGEGLYVEKERKVKTDDQKKRGFKTL